MSVAAQPQAELGSLGKLLKIANLQADAALKQAETRWEPWKVVVSALAAGGVMGGALVAGTVAILQVRIGL